MEISQKPQESQSPIKLLRILSPTKNTRPQILSNCNPPLAFFALIKRIISFIFRFILHFFCSMASTKCVLTTMKSQSSRTCMCSPTNHPGSFRCSMHKKPPRAVVARPLSRTPSSWNSSSMAAKANSLKAILLQMIKPSSHEHHRRKSFQPKPSRFSLMNNDNAAVVAVR